MYYHKDIVWKEGFDDIVKNMLKIRLIRMKYENISGFDERRTSSVIKWLKHNQKEYQVSELRVSDNIIDQFTIYFNYGESVYYIGFSNKYDYINSLFYLRLDCIKKWENNYICKNKPVEDYVSIDDGKNFEKIKRSKNCYSYTVKEMKEELGISDDTNRFN